MPLTVSNCSSAYFTAKFSSLTESNKVMLVMSSIAACCGLQLMLIMFSWIVRNCVKVSELSQCSKNYLYFAVGTMAMTLLVPLAYYVTLIIELPQCTVTYQNQQNIVVLLALAGVAFGCSALLWLMTACYAQPSQS
jgi:uncharacterized membrane protein